MKIRTALPILAVAMIALPLSSAPRAQEEAQPTPATPVDETAQAAEPEDASETAEALVARVNGEDISLFQLSRSVNQYVRANRLSPDSGMSIAEIQRVVLDRVIVTLLVEQEGRSLDLAANLEEVEARLAAMRAQVGSPEDFRLMLTVQNITEPELRRQVSQQITVEKVIEAEVFAKMRFEGEEIRAYYDEHKAELSGHEKIHARHIFIGLRPGMSDAERDDARRRVDDIKARLDGGEAFEDLAVALSEDASAAEGGDLGWISRDQVEGPFQVVAFSTPDGDISDVVATDYGYHIVQILEHRESGALTLEEARPTIEERLREAKTAEAVRSYIAGLREKAEIEMFLSLDEKDS